MSKRRNLDEFRRVKKNVKKIRPQESEDESDIDDQGPRPGRGRPATRGNPAPNNDQLPAGGGDMDIGEAGQRMGGGGGGNQTNGPTVAEETQPFGQTRGRYTKTFKRSYIIYVDNGVDYMAWAKTDATATEPDKTAWNEGWQIIPLGAKPMCITPQQWFQHFVQNRRHRYKSCKATIEGMIPFQENLGGVAANESTTTFSNRPNLHIYTDHDEFLPDDEDTLSTILHSDNGTLPYGPYQDTALVHKTFTFRNWAPNFQSIGTHATPIPATKPQQIFSLYTTGKVTSMYPGQSHTVKWVNKDTNWQSCRTPNDKLPWIMPTRITSGAEYRTQVTDTSVDTYWSGIRGQGYNYSIFDMSDLTTTQQDQLKKSNYLDTGKPQSEGGPPFFLIKMEQYYSQGNQPLPIYSQLHVHYEMEVEFETMDDLYPSQLNVNIPDMQPSVNPNSFDTQMKIATTAIPGDNRIHRLGGTQHEEVVFV